MNWFIIHNLTLSLRLLASCSFSLLLVGCSLPAWHATCAELCLPNICASKKRYHASCSLVVSPKQEHKGRLDHGMPSLLL
jgi:hypothetical protein